jgi:hypothetical protein
MQSTLKIDHTKAKKELERLFSQNIELREYHKEITEIIEDAFCDEDVEDDVIPIISHEVYLIETSKENSTHKCPKILILLENMEKASKKHPDLTEEHIYSFMKYFGSLDREIYKYLDLIYGLEKMEDEEEIDSEDEEEL